MTKKGGEGKVPKGGKAGRAPGRRGGKTRPFGFKPNASGYGKGPPPPPKGGGEGRGPKGDE